MTPLKNSQFTIRPALPLPLGEPGAKRRVRDRALDQLAPPLAPRSGEREAQAQRALGEGPAPLRDAIHGVIPSKGARAGGARDLTRAPNVTSYHRSETGAPN